MGPRPPGGLNTWAAQRRRHQPPGGLNTTASNAEATLNMGASTSHAEASTVEGLNSRGLHGGLNIHGRLSTCGLNLLEASTVDRIHGGLNIGGLNLLEASTWGPQHPRWPQHGGLNSKGLKTEASTCTEASTSAATSSRRPQHGGLNSGGLKTMASTSTEASTSEAST